MREVQFREALNEAMSEEMRRDSNIFLMGEVSIRNQILISFMCIIGFYI